MQGLPQAQDPEDKSEETNKEDRRTGPFFPTHTSSTALPPQEPAGSCTACGAGTEAPHLESIVQPQHRTGGYTPNPMQIARYQVGFIQPAAKHIIGFIPHPGKQCEVL